MRFTESVEKLIELHERIEQAGGTAPPALQPDISDAAASIILTMITAPGFAFYVSDPIRRIKAKDAVETLWGEISPEDILESLIYKSDGASFARDMIETYAYNVHNLPPIFPSVEFTAEQELYLIEAYQCLIWDLGGSAIMTCLAIIEHSLRIVLNISKRKRIPFARLISKAVDANYVDGHIKSELEELSARRNEIAHQLLYVRPDEAYTFLVRSISVLESLPERPQSGARS